MQQSTLDRCQNNMNCLSMELRYMARVPRSANDARRRDYEPKTPWQVWVKPLLEAREWNYADLAREIASVGKEADGVEVTENYIYRIVRGDPQKFKNAERPGYELAFAVGKILGDVWGSVRAAGYPLPVPGYRSVAEVELPGGISVGIPPGFDPDISDSDKEKIAAYLRLFLKEHRHNGDHPG